MIIACYSTGIFISKYVTCILKSNSGLFDISLNKRVIDLGIIPLYVKLFGEPEIVKVFPEPVCP